MSIRQLVRDDDAVSPVIGVIMMVAITVILAAVIGAFVLGLGEDLDNSAPTASIKANDASGDNAPIDAASGNAETHDLLIAEHVGGDQLSDGEYEIRVRHQSESTFTSLTDANNNEHSLSDPGNLNGASGDVSSIKVKISNHPTSFGTGDDVLLEVELTAGGSGSATFDYEDHEWDIQIVHTESGSLILDKTVTTY